MVLSRRQKLTLIPLLLYWPAIFILTHIPLAHIANIQIPASDKTLHCLAYLVLVFLLWFAISPDRKVSWRKSAVWWVLFVVAGYGGFDEWLQGYVGRSPSVMDFLADLAGALTGLVLLSIFPFWPVSLVLASVAIFILTNFSQANLADQLPVTNAAFHLFAYGFFSLLWTRYMYHLLSIKAPQPRWLIGALALPIGFLLSVELFSAVAGNGFRLSRVIISAVGITAVIAVVFLTALFRQGFTQKVSPNDA